MSIMLIGLNHRTAPVELREQLAFSRDGAATALLLFRNQYPQSEAAILSTCNRVEMIVAAEGDRPNIDDLVSFLAEARDLPVKSFRRDLYNFTDEQAVRHLYRVTSGLDSMVVGETQITNQVKAAYGLASTQGTTGRTLNRLFHHAFAVAKRVRTETQIGARKLSIPSVAVEVAKGIFSDFSDKQILVIGAGDMAQLVCQYLRKHEARHFTVTSRTLANATALARACQGQAVPFDQLDDQLARADMVITATNCPVAFLTMDRMRAAQKRRRGRPMFIIDLAVPRDVEHAVEKIRQIYVHDIDALGRIVAENQEHRTNEAASCEKILDEEIGAFAQWLAENHARPLIQQMFGDAHELRDFELIRLFNACPDLDERQRQAVTALADRLINKLIHPCVSTLRKHSRSPTSAMLAKTLHSVLLKHRSDHQPDR